MPIAPMRITPTARLILHMIRDAPGGPVYGLRICQATGRPGGTVYPLLNVMELHGLVTSRWQDADDVEHPGRPRRRYYELTEHGRSVLGN